MRKLRLVVRAERNCIFKCLDEPPARLLPRCAVSDQLGQHRIVERAHALARRETMIDTHAISGCGTPMDRARFAAESFGSVFGI